MKLIPDEAQLYLAPYLQAAEEYGAGFGSLLWASPKTQRARFEAIRAAYDLHGRRLLDAGCGRADLLEYLLSRAVVPSEYIGVEAVEPLARAAESRANAACRIVRNDFVRRPACLFAGAEVVIFSGSLNTLGDAEFFATLGHACRAASKAVVFNFLSSNQLAGKAYLFWRSPAEVTAFLRSVGAEARVVEGYLPGDCTITACKPVSA